MNCNGYGSNHAGKGNEVWVNSVHKLVDLYGFRFNTIRYTRGRQ